LNENISTAKPVINKQLVYIINIQYQIYYKETGTPFFFSI